jgi:beta-glucanase (GH16 family)
MSVRAKSTERRPARRSGAAVLAAILALGGLTSACVRVSAPEAAASQGPLTVSPDGRRLRLTFDEEFDRFDRWAGGHGRWRTVYRDGRSADPFELRTLRGNKELQLYVDPDLKAGLDPFQARSGVLEITAQPMPQPLVGKLGGFRYASGLITTQPSFAQAYGYFEMRARLPRGKGLWPAFWLLPADLSWPPELDVMESIGDPGRVYATAHSKALERPTTELHVTDPDAFHVYAVSWDPKQIAWFIDGREVKRQPTPPDMNKPMYILANLAVGGNWPGAPDATTRWPARMSIDYIRAYRFAP